MRKLLLIVTMLLLTLSCFAQNGKSIYRKYCGKKDVSCVYISPAMFKLIGKIPDIDMGDGDMNLTPVVKSLKAMYLVDSENESINGSIRNDVEKFVNAGNYEMLMEVIDGGEVIHIYTMGTEDTVSDFIMLSCDASECTFICLEGNISRTDLEKMLSDSQ